VDLPSDAVLYPGHGVQDGLELLARQRGYIERFVKAVRSADWSEVDRARETVIRAVAGYLGGDDLRFLMELSIEPVAAQLY
jgi:hypothetical protein